MITQELLGFMRAELAKGKTRGEIHDILTSGGGWSEDDLSEAFREIIPMQNITPKINPMGFVSVSPGAPSPIMPSISAPAPAPAPRPTMSSPPSPPFSSSPIRNFSTPSTPSTYSPSPTLLRPNASVSKTISPHHSHAFIKFLIILIIIAGLGYGGWYYRSRITGLWGSLINKVSNLSVPSTGSSQNVVSNNQPVAPAPTTPTVVIPPVMQTKDCGLVTSPKIDTPSTYENIPVLSCLGASAVNCENTKGVLNDNFFPSIFEIIKTQNSCNFKLSYPADSSLVDKTGNKLAGQYITCPLGVVKAVDNTKPATPKFIAPNTTDFGKYASQIYFYGTLGLFSETGLDPNKIQALGCSGPYIQSMIASYATK